MFSKLVKKLVPSASIAISEKAKELKKKGIPLIDLSIGEPDFTIPPNIARAVRKAVNKGYTKYTNSRGIHELREAISGDIKRKYNLSYSSQDIIVTPGAKQAILYALFTILEKRDQVIVPEPCWLSYEPCINIANGKYVPVSLLERDSVARNKEKIISKINKKTKASLINNPVNPTGTVWSKADLNTIADIAKKFNLWVISDEIYDEIIFDNNKMISMASLPGMKSRAILINGFSKTYAMTGFRIGYIAGPPEFVSEALKIHQHSATCASSLSQYAALEALSPKTRKYLKRMQKEYQRRRNLVYQGFNNTLISCPKPQGTFYGFLDIKKMGMNSLEAANFLLEKANIVTIPGSAYGKAGEGCLRISFATSYKNLQKATSNLKKITKYFQ